MNPVLRTSWNMPRAGSLGRLRLEQSSLPDRQRGELTVKVRAIGLNFADIFACLGLYSATPRGAFVPGLEFAGEVEEALAADIGRPELAGRVMGVTRFGGFTTHLNVDARYLAPLPSGWSYEEGAAFPAQSLTAWYAIHKLGQPPARPVVLLHSAAGGVGLQALALLKQLEARVVATVGSPHKKDYLGKCYGLAPSQIIVRNRSAFGSQLDAALKIIPADGFDLILDSVAGPYFSPGYLRLRPMGRLIIFGAADFMSTSRRPNYLKLGWNYLRRPRIDPLAMIAENRSVMGFNLIWLWGKVDLMGTMMEEALGALPDPPLVGETFSFADLPKALERFQTGQTMGKVVVRVEAEPVLKS